MCGLVCPSRTSERDGKGYCVKGGWREERERVKVRARRSVNQSQTQTQPQTKLRRCRRKSGGCGGGVFVGGGGRTFYYTYIYSEKGQACEGAELVSVVVAETIHPACMNEGGGRGGEGGGRAIGPENAVGEWARRRRVSRGQAIDRAECG